MCVDYLDHLGIEKWDNMLIYFHLLGGRSVVN